MYWAYQNDRYFEGFAVMSGVMFAYFPNIEGTQKHRILGMIIGFAWAWVYLAIYFLVNDWHSFIKIPLLMLMIFSTSMLSVYNQRGAMVSFGGLFAIVMGFAMEDYPFTAGHILMLSFLGGLFYLVVGGGLQFFFQNRHVTLLLSETITQTARFMELGLLSKSKSGFEDQYELIKIQNKLNENHEILRALLMNDKYLITGSNQSRRQYLLFRELIDIYEMGFANLSYAQNTEDELKEHFNFADPFFEGYDLSVKSIHKLGKAVRYNKEIEIDAKLFECLNTLETNIDLYVKIVGLPQARGGALLLRNLLDSLQKLTEKLHFMYRVNLNLVTSDHLILHKNRVFITPEDYSLKTLLENINDQSVVFRHSLRITLAVFLSFCVGYLTNPDFTNWIVVTALVILRPNFGLTKNRAYNRMIGTFVGGALMLVLMTFSQNRILIGSLAGLSVIIGFSYLQKNYKIATAYITFSILGLYILNHHEPLNIVLNRSVYTIAGVLISLFSVYFLWPVWEKSNIKTEIKHALLANEKYLSSVNMIYSVKSLNSTDYKLVRKEAFLKNGNLTAAFQRMQDEPQSKRDLSNNVYALVLLNQTFLSAIAGFSAYIQGHTTTSPSPQFSLIMARIIENLHASAENIPDKDPQKSEAEINAAFRILDKKYQDINNIRNKELESGKTQIDAEMRDYLQEGKVILEQLRWFYSLSVNIRSMISIF